MTRLDPISHMLACFHEAAHAAVFHYTGFHVFGASVVNVGSKLRNTVGRTQWVVIDKEAPELVERMAMGHCAGYVCEMLAYGIERFEGNDVVQFCSNDGGSEVGYASDLCYYLIGEDAFDDVILKTKHLLLMPDISDAVCSLADLLQAHGKIDHRQIAEAMSHVGDHDLKDL